MHSQVYETSSEMSIEFEVDGPYKVGPLQLDLASLNVQNPMNISFCIA